MTTYNNVDRNNDFDFFIENYQKFFELYGHVFLAIRNKKVLGTYDSVSHAVDDLSKTYKPGDYIIQECTGEDSAYRTSIMRLMIRG